MTHRIGGLARAQAVERVLLRYGSLPFAWGASDCMTPVEDYLESLGRLPWRRPKRTTASGARRALAREGAADVAALFDLHFTRIAPLAAATGDLAALPGHDGAPTASIVNGALAFAMTPDGLAPAPLRAALAAWRI